MIRPVAGGVPAVTRQHVGFYRRLHRLRQAILLEWKRLDAREKAGETGIDGTRYNQLAAAYNAVLEAFPDLAARLQFVQIDAARH